jgi:hypothetical protein
VIVIGEYDHTCAQVARVQHSEVTAQTTAGTTVVGNGDNRS